MKLSSLLIIVFALSLTSFAAVPLKISYQGQLTDGGGSPVPDATYPVVFTIYDASGGGNSKWTESQNVTTTGGNFAISLGSVAPIEDTVFSGSTRYLGIKIDTDPEMTPRTILVSVPYAYRVNSLDSAQGGAILSKVTIGQSHINTGDHSFVAGRFNEVTGNYSVISGGGGNNIGKRNHATGLQTTIGGGVGNTASGSSATVGGGNGNSAIGINSAIAGGQSNQAAAISSTVSGGTLNIASGVESTIGGGKNNDAVADQSTIGGGQSCFTNGSWATVGGGLNNEAVGESSTISGGKGNNASGDFSTVCGGQSNSSTGYRAIVAGGFSNDAAGSYSFAGGQGAQAAHDHSFVWSSGTAGFASSASGQFNVKAFGGVRFASNGTATAGVELTAGASAWAVLSDSTLKRNIREVDYNEILNKVGELKISQWSYKAQDETVEHIGPMSQDFHYLFDLGDDNRRITTIDPDGVSLAAIKALHIQNQELKARLEKLEELVENLSSE